jgi:hypothetical protein
VTIAGAIVVDIIDSDGEEAADWFDTESAFTFGRRSARMIRPRGWKPMDEMTRQRHRECKRRRQETGATKCPMITSRDTEQTSGSCSSRPQIVRDGLSMLSKQMDIEVVGRPGTARRHRDDARDEM